MSEYEWSPYSDLPSHYFYGISPCESTTFSRMRALLRAWVTEDRPPARRVMRPTASHDEPEYESPYSDLPNCYFYGLSPCESTTPAGLKQFVAQQLQWRADQNVSGYGSDWPRFGALTRSEWFVARDSGVWWVGGSPPQAPYLPREDTADRELVWRNRHLIPEIVWVYDNQGRPVGARHKLPWGVE